ncbi:TPA: hypothetical protein ACH3X1_014391 [Trebouxia sp. C0004]
MPSLREVLGDKPSLGRHYNYLLRHKDKQVCFESTGHAEYSELVNILSSTHNPITPNRASNTSGTQ